MRYRVFMPQSEVAASAVLGEALPFPAAYDYAGSVSATGLDAAFHAAQNHDQPWLRLRPTRSVCVGDVLVDPADQAWRVTRDGFAAVPLPAVDLSA
jgi:hypothetical protein